jgi:hypothetical protein
MKRHIYGLFIILFTGVAFTLTSCSDDSGTGSDSLNCNTFTLPSQLTPVLVSNEYFNNQNVPNGVEYETYQQVKNVALSGGGFLSGGGVFGIATTFIAAAQLLGIQPEAGDGSCVWEFDASQFDPDASETIVTVNASQSGGRTLWEVNISGDVGNETVSNFTFISGFTSDDGNSGEWRGVDPENSGSEAYVYTWNRESEEVYQLTLNVEDGDDASVTYERDGASSNSMSFFNGSNDFSIFWNESDDSGWIEESGSDRRCYADFVNAPC